jgi:hypothetical protein
MYPTPAEKYGLTPGRGVVAFAPMTMMAMSLGSMAIGGGLSAASTIAGGNSAVALGNAQKAQANYQADQITENAGGELGAAQRQMLDTQQKTRLATSEAIARAAGNGVNAGVGSPVAITKSIASRGSYQSLMDLWQGQNKYTNDLNTAAAVRQSGDIALAGAQMEQQADNLKAAGTIAGTAGSMTSAYGNFRYPMMRGGMNYG